MTPEALLALDRAHLWHPYAPPDRGPLWPVAGARGVRIELADGRELIDGMASWWCAIHGYNHPRLNQAVTDQLEQMAHVMFGGLTHEPAATLAERLVAITPEGLERVFFTDSGSVSVEVALKMALQYWRARGERRHRFLTVRGGYHGDTFGAMSVSDPETGLHTLYQGYLPGQLFAPRPPRRFDEPCTADDLAPLAELARRHAGEIAAVILEPVVQGAGGMYFYAPDYLVHLRALCDELGLLLIFDEIATGFGRTGRLFAAEWAGVTPDILCLGKSLTGGYLTLAATLVSPQVAETIGQGEPGVLMHGPTFMANPLACAVANASVELLLESPWQNRIAAIEKGLKAGLAPCRTLRGVREVRVLGAIGVVELEEPVDMEVIQPALVDAGVWVRPFGRLVYLMPPYVIEAADLEFLCRAVVQVLESCLCSRTGR